MISKNKIIVFMIVIATFTGILFTGCSKQERGSTIKNVIELMFNCPNEELINLSNKMVDEITNTQETGLSLTEQSQPEFFNKIDELYKSYFTEKGYDTFLRLTFPYRFHIDAYEAGYTLKVNKVTVTPNKKIPTNFSFTAEILYGPKDGEQSKFEVTGSAQLQEEGDKISYIQFFNINELLKNMIDNK